MWHDSRSEALQLCFLSCRFGSSERGLAECGASGLDFPLRCVGTPAWRQISPRRRHPAGLGLGEAGECRAPAAMGIWKEGKLQREFSGCCALRYMSPVVVGSLNEQLHNPELDTSSPDVPTRRRRLHLRAATARMKAAALGQDLDMHDAGEAQKPTLQGPLTQALVHCFSSPTHGPHKSQP